jgi:hypothetical protein
LVDGWVVDYDTLSGFVLTTSSETVARGDQITFQLRNVTGEDQTSGNRSKYTIHRETPAGWRDIFFRAPESAQIPAYDDDAITHPPDGGFSWQLTFSRAGLAHDIENGSGSLAVCPPLQPDTYRFVYWGVGMEEELESDTGTERALAVQFSVSSD